MADMKVFGLGLSKTGTNSLTQALNILGYNTLHFPRFRYINHECYLYYEEFQHYDAFTDTPIAATYKTLDKQFPDSKFILTVRDMDTWLRSCERHFKPGRFDNHVTHPDSNYLHLQLYNSTDFDREKFEFAYFRHYYDVLLYFSGERKNDLLILDIVNGDSWDQLCGFLSKTVPQEDFPCENKKSYEMKTR